MGEIKDDMQIIKGKLQGAKGGMQQTSGDELGGLVEKAKGKANEVVGKIRKDIRINSKSEEESAI